MRIEGDSPARLVLEKGEVVDVLGMQIIYRKKGNILTKKHGYTFQTPKILDQIKKEISVSEDRPEAAVSYTEAIREIKKRLSV